MTPELVALTAHVQATYAPRIDCRGNAICRCEDCAAARNVCQCYEACRVGVHCHRSTSYRAWISGYRACWLELTPVLLRLTADNARQLPDLPLVVTARSALAAQSAKRVKRRRNSTAPR